MQRKLTTAMLLSAAAASPAFGQYALTTLVTFTGSNFTYPRCTLVADANGNLYGTTYGGGTDGDGTVFKVAAGTHAFSTLVNFNLSNGAEPTAGLIVDSAGNLYGTTEIGGNLALGNGFGAGTAFEVAAGTNAVTTLATFGGTDSPDGNEPIGGLTMDGAGNLYGTTNGGGPGGAGVVYEIPRGVVSPSLPTGFGPEAGLVSFDSGISGDYPKGRLLIDASGNLYGTTNGAGGFNANLYGSVFEVNPNANSLLPPTLSTLVTFNGTNGAEPLAGLVADARGNLYGTTMGGGINGIDGGYGTVFEIAAGTDTLTTLHSFTGADGASPVGDLLIDSSGNLYGTTSLNGGSVFEIAAGSNAFSTLYTFTGGAGESGPEAGLIMDANGNLYGTTAGNGSFGTYGTVFELSPTGATLTWNRTGGTGDGQTWDTSGNQNWNNGSAPAVFHAGDNITFNDSNAGNYTVTLNTTVGPASVTVNSTGNYTISGTGGIIGTESLTKLGIGTLTLSTVNSYSGGTNVSAGRLLIEPTSSTTSALPQGALAINGSGVVQLADNVTAGTTLAASNVVLTSLSISGNGTLDIGNNRIIIDYSSAATDPIASIAAWIKNGFYGLSGPAIISSDIVADDLASGLSYGIGYADGADGLVAGLPSGEIEIAFTLLGDANLDGTVNSEDFTPFSTNLGKPGGWDQGDFNYDGTVNTEDFTSFSHNLGQTASLASDLVSANGIDLANVPEPVSAGMMVMAGVGILRRRRRGK